MFRRYPGLFLLFFTVAGILSADCLHPPVWVLFAVSAIGTAGGFFFLGRRRKLPGVLFFALCLGGFAAFNYHIKCYDTGLNHLSKVTSVENTYQLYGKVSAWPQLKSDRTEIIVSLDSVKTEDIKRVTGSILLKIADTTTALQRGDYVTFMGRIYPVSTEKKIGGFNYNRYLNMKGVFGIVYKNSILDIQVDRRSPVGFYQLTDWLRRAVLNSFQRNLSPTSAALAGGFLIGETRDIPGDIYRMFRNSGTFHLLAVSGSNVALVLLFFLILMQPFNFSGRKRAFVLIVVIILFCALAYGEPSVVRASLMAGLVIIARFFQRRYDLNHIIALSALIILLIAPAQLFDIGFQLSFATTWGLIYIMPALSDIFKNHHSHKWYRWVIFPVLISLVAQLCSTPVMIYYFDRVPALTVLANLVVVPLVSVGFLGSLALLVADLVFPLLGQFAGSLVNIILHLVVSVLTVLGGEDIPVFKTGSLTGETDTMVFILFLFILISLAVPAFKNQFFRRVGFMVMLVGLNLFLVEKVFSSRGNESLGMELAKIPGGVVALIRTGGLSEADLIITGMIERKYPVEEKILTPVFEKARLDKIKRLFILTADFKAIDDILRLAELFRVEKIYAAAYLKASLTDILARGNFHFPEAFDISFFSPAVEPKTFPGYYADEKGFWLILEHSRVLFTNRVTEAVFAPNEDKHQSILVIGECWSPSENDWASLSGAGYGIIICSKIEPPFHLTSGFTASYHDRSRPDFLYDLERQGPLYLSLPSQ